MKKIGLYVYGEKIYECPAFQLYAGVMRNDGSPLLIKVPRSPSEEEIFLLGSEYTRGKDLLIPSILRPLDVIHGETRALALEWFDGLPLITRPGGQPLEPLSFMNTALGICDAVAQVHGEGLVHQNLNPETIFIDNGAAADRGLPAVRITGLAFMEPEGAGLPSPGMRSLKKAYISPEQTGRTGLPVDRRSDIYSLGIILYEMLTGRHPFPEGEGREMIHAHLAVTPETPRSINNSVPEALSQIVMRTLAKHPDDRYESVNGLAADIERCLRQFREEGRIGSYEEISGSSARFIFPEKLYGRDEEIALLEDAFTAARTGTSRFFLVGGYSGVGKTSLVMALRGTVEREGGRFTSGKFEQFRADQPYSALIDACRGLVRQILAAGPDEINSISGELIEALAPNERLIIDLVPELAHITGPGREISPVGPVESKNRLHFYFRRFIQVFAREGSPLAVFLDDLQWVDTATLDLVRFLMDGGTERILFVGAYRDNEVDGDHPLSRMMEDVAGRFSFLHRLTLANLDRDDLAAIAAHCFKAKNEEARKLAGLMHGKTGGNPFFTRELLELIHRSELVRFDGGGLYINEGGIDALSSSENMAEILSNRIHSLPDELREVLKTGSCISGALEPELIAAVMNRERRETDAALEGLASQGMLERKGDAYFFSHDRVREESMRLLGGEELPALHLAIGSILRKRDSGDEALFQTLDHLNAASSLIRDEKERAGLASLNLRAGLASKSRAAFAPARDYFRTGVGLLGDDPWRDHYALTRDLHRELAEAEYLNGNFRESERIVNESIKRLNSNTEKAEFLKILVMQYLNEGKPEDSIQTGIEALRLLNVIIPNSNIDSEIQKYIVDIDDILNNPATTSLVDLPDITDKDILLSLSIMIILSDSCYLCNPQLLILFSIKPILINLQYGNSSMAPYCSILYSFACIYLRNDYKTALKFLNLTLEHIQRRNDTVSLSDIYLKCSLISYWLKPINESVLLNKHGLREGIKSGRLVSVGYIKTHDAINEFCRGSSLVKVRECIIDGLNTYSEFNITIMKSVFYFMNILLFGLTGEMVTDKKIHDQSDYRHLLNECYINREISAICLFYLYSVVISFLFEKYQETIEYLLKSEEIIHSLTSIFHTTDLPLYRALTLCALYGGASETERGGYLAQIETDVDKMKLWAGNCPENFLHKQHLMEAELCRVTGRDMEALDLYAAAAGGAAEQGFIQEQALAEELAGRFWHQRKNARYAGGHFRRARDLYREWGAVKKVEHLANSFPEYFPGGAAPDAGVSGWDGDRRFDSIDAASLAASSQALSGEIEVENLMKKILEIGLQNSGAERGCLFVERQAGLYLEAFGPDREGAMHVLQSIPFEEYPDAPRTVINYVANTNEAIILDNAVTHETFGSDPYILENGVKSIICLPLNHSGRRVAIGYMENNLMESAFTRERLDVLMILAGQAAISLINSRYYEEQRHLVEKLSELNHLKDQILENYNTERYRNLQDRMMPHFFFNAINAVHSLIISNPEKAGEAVLTLSDIYHYIVDRSFETLVPFDEEWVFVGNYLEFEMIRFPRTLSHRIEMKGEFSGVMIPPLTVQPLAENAIKHGLRKREGAGTVTVHAINTNGRIRIEVRDDGAGVRSSDPYSRSLGNIRDRLLFHYPDAELDLHDREGGGADSVITFSTGGARGDEAKPGV